jgi:hypothetical protein
MPPPCPDLSPINTYLSGQVSPVQFSQATPGVDALWLHTPYALEPILLSPKA